MQQRDMTKWEIVTGELIQMLKAALAEGSLKDDSAPLSPETSLAQLRLKPLARSRLFRKIERRFGVALSGSLTDFETIQDVVDDILQQTTDDDQKTLLKSFFRDVWMPRLFEHSGDNLIEEINKQRPRKVLDIGCGPNYFKDKIDNLVGLDLVNPRADIICDFMEFNPAGEGFDVILALGSLNFGSRKTILAMLQRIKIMLADEGRVYLRVNPGIPWPQQPNLIIYPWSEEKIYGHGLDAGFAVAGPLKYETGEVGTRISFCYVHRPIN